MSDRENPHKIRTQSVREPMEFSLKTAAETRDRLAEDLGIRGIRKLTFDGSLRAEGTSDLALTGKLGATVVQDCVVTGEPVTTRIDEAVERRFLANLPEPEGDEVEMPEDENADLLPETLDLSEIMAEALALALPPWPRAEDVEPVNISVTEPGKTPMSDDDAKPFAAPESTCRKGREGWRRIPVKSRLLFKGIAVCSRPHLNNGLDKRRRSA